MNMSGERSGGSGSLPFPSCRSGTHGWLPEISSTRNERLPKEALPLMAPRRAGSEPAAGDASEMMTLKTFGSVCRFIGAACSVMRRSFGAPH